MAQPQTSSNPNMNRSLDYLKQVQVCMAITPHLRLT